MIELYQDIKKNILTMFEEDWAKNGPLPGFEIKGSMYVLRVFLTSWCVIGCMCVSVCV